MSQDESPQPASPPGQRLSRDTMLLVGALAFLIIALVLTFFFTPNLGTQTGQVAQTVSAAALTPTDTQAAGTALAATDVSASLAPSAGSVFPTASAYPSAAASASAYPGPVGGAPDQPALGSSSSPYPGFEETVIASSGVDDRTALPLDSPIPAGPAYPSPEPDGTPPPQPTFRPTRVAAALPTSVPAPTSSPVPTSSPAPTIPAAPTSAPAPPIAPVPTSAPAPTSIPDQPKEPPAPQPTSPPVDVLRGSVRWPINQSPIIVRHDVQIAPGAELLIEPGVEVRLDPGVSIYVDGARLLAMGLPDQPVRFVGSTRARWSGIFGRPGSFILMENTQISGGGAGGTVMAVDTSELTVRNSRIFDNGGGIIVTDTKLEMKETEITANDVPFGAALDASYARGTTVTLQRNRIGGNRLSEGAPMVRVANQSTFSTLILDISGNLFRNGTPNLQLLTNGPLQGSVACNTLVNDSLGIGLRTQTLQVNPNGAPPFDLSFQNNLIDDHLPPIIPVYLKYGLGRGATSEVLIDMRNNWWGEASGPYEPDVNPLGRGDSVGSNIIFSPWLTQPPACVPSR